MVLSMTHYPNNHRPLDAQFRLPIPLSGILEVASFLLNLLYFPDGDFPALLAAGARAGGGAGCHSACELFF
jgi:hypothetical protein